VIQRQQRERLAALIAATGLALTLAAPMVRAAALVPSAGFGPPSGSFVFGTSITFSETVQLYQVPKRVELLLSEPGSIGPTVIEVANPGAGQHTVSDVLKIADGHVFPNTPFTVRWRVTEPDGSQDLGPSMNLTYQDTRFDWHTKTGPIVRVHWYQGDDAFGARALAIGEQGIANAAALLGVTETKPIDFYIYDSTTPFYDALGPGTRENVGGEADAQIRTLFALITPAEISASWVGVVIPHELTHLVFNTAIDNPYHAPSRWLNEGLAVYLSEGYTTSWKATVSAAAASSGVIPLDGLVGQFPTSADLFRLAYGESVSAVDFMIRKYGKPALVKLIRSYATGLSDDEAFSAALGVDTAGFNAAWLKDLGAATPRAYGPLPAPAGPLPSGWGDAPVAVGGPSGAPVTAPVDSGPNSPSADGSLALIGGAAILIVLVGGGLLLLRSRRSRPGSLS
jgi:hypothetical protein